MEKEKIIRIIETLLFTSHQPLTEKRLGEVLEEIDKPTLRQSLEELKEEYQKKENFEIKEVAGGYQIFTRAHYAPWIEKLHKTKPAKLSQAALETLAVIAYNQPIIKAEIKSIRGVDSSGVLSTLLEKDLIKMLGRKKVIGRPLLYGITDTFLKYFGLKDISELPSIEEVKELIAPNGEDEKSTGDKEETSNEADKLKEED
jgi:segregation and condensation protein B